MSARPSFIVLDPALCPGGLSVEMTVKVDPAATMYRAPRYILDSGASSFNSRGVALYTLDNKLRADVAVKDKAYCLVVPLVTDKWQDVVLTYHQNGGTQIIMCLHKRNVLVRLDCFILLTFCLMRTKVH